MYNFLCELFSEYIKVTVPIFEELSVEFMNILFTFVHLLHGIKLKFSSYTYIFQIQTSMLRNVF
jgi:hypothetical protein